MTMTTLVFSSLCRIRGIFSHCLALQDSAAAAEHAQALMTSIMKGKKLPWGKAKFELQQQQHQQKQQQQQEEVEEEQRTPLQLQPHPPSDSRSSSVAPRQVPPSSPPSFSSWLLILVQIVRSDVVASVGSGKLPLHRSDAHQEGEVEEMMEEE
jgi:hypothetical protein